MNMRLLHEENCYVRVRSVNCYKKSINNSKSSRVELTPIVGN